MTVDARGLRCPIPVVRLARHVQELTPGDEVVVLASDPAAQWDIPAWARMKGHVCSAAEVTHDPWEVRFVVTVVS